jgi:hypothetical protein
MKITIEIDNADLPFQFDISDPAGLENLLQFLHKCLVSERYSVLVDNEVQAPYRKAFYDSQGMNGQAWIDAIKATAEEDLALGKLLTSHMKVTNDSD